MCDRSLVYSLSLGHVSNLKAFMCHIRLLAFTWVTVIFVLVDICEREPCTGSPTADICFSHLCSCIGYCRITCDCSVISVKLFIAYQSSFISFVRRIISVAISIRQRHQWFGKDLFSLSFAFPLWSVCIDLQAEFKTWFDLTLSSCDVCVYVAGGGFGIFHLLMLEWMPFVPPYKHQWDVIVTKFNSLHDQWISWQVIHQKSLQFMIRTRTFLITSSLTPRNDPISDLRLSGCDVSSLTHDAPIGISAKSTSNCWRNLCRTDTTRSSYCIRKTTDRFL